MVAQTPCPAVPPPPPLASHPGGTQAPHLSHPEGPPGKTLVSVRQDAIEQARSSDITSLSSPLTQFKLSHCVAQGTPPLTSSFIACFTSSLIKRPLLFFSVSIGDHIAATAADDADDDFAANVSCGRG